MVVYAEWIILVVTVIVALGLHPLRSFPVAGSITDSAIIGGAGAVIGLQILSNMGYSITDGLDYTSLVKHEFGCKVPFCFDAALYSQPAYSPAVCPRQPDMVLHHHALVVHAARAAGDALPVFSLPKVLQTGDRRHRRQAQPQPLPAIRSIAHYPLTHTC